MASIHIYTHNMGAGRAIRMFPPAHNTSENRYRAGGIFVDTVDSHTALFRVRIIDGWEGECMDLVKYIYE